MEKILEAIVLSRLPNGTVRLSPQGAVAIVLALNRAGYEIVPKKPPADPEVA